MNIHKFISNYFHFDISEQDYDKDENDNFVMLYNVCLINNLYTFKVNDEFDFVMIDFDKMKLRISNGSFTDNNFWHQFDIDQNFNIINHKFSAENEDY